MKERQILMNHAMVSATLAGHKTQTRRIVKPQPFDGFPHKGSIDFDGFLPHEDVAQWSAEALGGGAFKTETQECPYGTVGDRLYVRETFYAFGRWETRYSEKKKRDEWHFVDMTVECGHTYVYAADGAPRDFKKGNQRSDRTPSWWKRPAIHMPRRASRILLKVTGVRVERLTDISEQDALAEGIMPHCRGGWHWHKHDPLNMDDWHQFGFKTPQLAFESLWTMAIGADSWQANPWVWVVEFRRIA